MSKRSKLILVVEDNPDDELFILHTLGQAATNHMIHVAHDGQEAVDYLMHTTADNARTVPDVIFMDIKMPKMSGFDVLRRIRAHEATRCIPVVLLTSSDEERDVKEAYHLGANSFLRKHTDFEQFTRTVTRATEYWTMLNVPAM